MLKIIARAIYLLSGQTLILLAMILYLEDKNIVVSSHFSGSPGEHWYLLVLGVGMFLNAFLDSLRPRSVTLDHAAPVLGNLTDPDSFAVWDRERKAIYVISHHGKSVWTWKVPEKSIEKLLGKEIREISTVQHYGKVRLCHDYEDGKFRIVK